VRYAIAFIRYRYSLVSFPDQKIHPMPYSNKQIAFRVELIVFAVLVTVGVACRFLIETPNFKPIAAFALFAGFFFRKPAFAVGAVLLAMALSDLQLGFYQWPLLLSVYASLGVSVLLGMLIRNKIGCSSKVDFKLAGSFVGASLVMSSVFYLLTNGAVWAIGGWYSSTWAGLVECFAAGVPFYRWTLTGDLFFTMATIGSYALVLMAVKVRTSVGANPVSAKCEKQTASLATEV
jgi:hypothetical protein